MDHDADVGCSLVAPAVHQSNCASAQFIQPWGPPAFASISDFHYRQCRVASVDVQARAVAAMRQQNSGNRYLAKQRCAGSTSACTGKLNTTIAFA
jgi:hypothetical protein